MISFKETIKVVDFIYKLMLCILMFTLLLIRLVMSREFVRLVTIIIPKHYRCVPFKGISRNLPLGEKQIIILSFAAAGLQALISQL